MTALALTMGDPAGIGPDIAIAAWRAARSQDIPPFLLIADPEVIAARARLLGLEIDCLISTPERAEADFARGLPVLPLACGAAVEPGQPDGANAEATIASIRQAVDVVTAGRLGAVVTNPIAKSVLYDAGFTFPGHTEFLAALAGDRTGKPVRPVMLLANQHLRVAPATIHIPLSAVPASLTEDLIVETGRIMAADLSRRFGVAEPRLAVSGLNPHAGESGALGSEDEAVVAPAIARLRAEGIDAFGPLPADTMFHEEARAGYDAALCMYHDQALIPVKTLGFHDGVNVTLGLPFIRTSPDHGTAFSLAGSGRARADSLIAALQMAAGMVQAEDAAPLPASS